MSETQRDTPDVAGLGASFQEVSSEISRAIEQDILPMTRLLEEAFASVARSIDDELARAARSGKASIKSLVQEILSDLARLATDRLVRQPLQDILGSVFSGGFGGARAFGGFAAQSSAFLVGERGPELFVPGQSGRVQPMAGARQSGGNITVNLNMGPMADARSFRQSEPQIAAALSRALARAGRNG